MTSTLTAQRRWGNDLCGFEEGIITRSYDIDCEEEHVMNLNF